MSDMRAHLTGYFLAGVSAAGAKSTLPAILPQSAPVGKTIILGCGKAAAEMAEVAANHLSGRITGCVVTRHGHGVGRAIPGVAVIEPRETSPLALVHFDKVLVTKAALDQLKEMFA